MASPPWAAPGRWWTRRAAPSPAETSSASTTCCTSDSPTARTSAPTSLSRWRASPTQLRRTRPRLARPASGQSSLPWTHTGTRARRCVWGGCASLSAPAFRSAVGPGRKAATPVGVLTGAVCSCASLRLQHAAQQRPRSRFVLPLVGGVRCIRWLCPWRWGSPTLTPLHCCRASAPASRPATAITSWVDPCRRACLRVCACRSAHTWKTSTHVCSGWRARRGRWPRPPKPFACTLTRWTGRQTARTT